MSVPDAVTRYPWSTSKPIALSWSSTERWMCSKWTIAGRRTGISKRRRISASKPFGVDLQKVYPSDGLLLKQGVECQTAYLLTLNQRLQTIG